MTLPGRYPPATWKPVVNHSGSMASRTSGLIPHVQQGNGSLFARFNTPSLKVSSHLWLSKAGAWEQYVDLRDRAWAEAAGNGEWISIECEGFDTEDYSTAQLTLLAEFFAWGAQYDAWPLQICDSASGRGLGTHVMGGAAWGGHSCPGPIRAGRRKDILAAAGGHSTGDDMDLAELDAAGKAPGKSGLIATIVASCVAAETAVNRAVDATAAANKAVAAVAPIQSWINSLPGDLPGLAEPPAAPAVLAALHGFSRSDLAAIVSAGVQLLAAA